MELELAQLKSLMTALTGGCVHVYIDDIIIFSDTFE
jgi:hypothetical protein